MQSVIARVESVLYISYQSYTLIQTTLGVWLGWVWPFLCNYFAVFAYRHCRHCIHYCGNECPSWASSWFAWTSGRNKAIRPSDQTGLTLLHTDIITRLMTGLMIFNIASLEVSPHQPHPSLYPELPGNYHHQGSSSHTSDVSLLLSFVNISVSPQLTLFLSVTLDSKSFYL